MLANNHLNNGEITDDDELKCKYCNREFLSKAGKNVHQISGCCRRVSSSQGKDDASLEYRNITNNIEDLNNDLTSLTSIIDLIKDEPMEQSVEEVKLLQPGVSPFVTDLQDVQNHDPYHDVTIVTHDGGMLTCHGVLLAAASEVFAEMLEVACNEDESVLILAENLDNRGLKNFLDFLYVGCVVAGNEDLKCLKLLLEEYRIQFTVEKMSDYVELPIESGAQDIVDRSHDDEGHPMIGHMDEVRVEDEQSDEHDLSDNDFAYTPGGELYSGKIRKKKSMPGRIGRPPNSVRKLRKRRRRNIINREEPEESLFTSVCDYCGKKSKNLIQTRRHVKKEHSEFFDEFSRKYEVTPCEVCGNKFINMTLLYQHRRKVHPELMQDVILPDGKKKIGRRRVFTIDDGLPYLADRKCDHCGQILADIRQWTDHVQAHTTGYSCDICGKKFKVGVTHRRHMRTHETSLTPLLCNQCGSTFTTEFDYEKHNRRHSFDKFRKSNKKSEKKEETFFGLCNVCGKKFTVKTAYDYHVKTAHLEEHELFKCPHCPSTFRDKGVYEHHLPLHFDPTLPCPHCDKMFKTKHYLRNHMRAAHVPDEMKKFVCGQCGKGFTERNTYEGHVNMHLGLKPYRCRYCDMRYQNASNKLNHEKSRHPDLYTTQKTNPMAGISVTKRDQMLATRDG